MNRKILLGKVEKLIEPRSAVVSIVRSQRHARYQKVVKKVKKLMAANTVMALVGSEVEIVESRPLSRRQRFTVKRVIKKS